MDEDLEAFLCQYDDVVRRNLSLPNNRFLLIKCMGQWIGEGDGREWWFTNDDPPVAILPLEKNLRFINALEVKYGKPFKADFKKYRVAPSSLTMLGSANAHAVELVREFTKEDLAAIKWGSRPSSQDQKWYVYYENDTIIFCNSLSQEVYFSVEVSQQEGGCRTGRVLANNLIDNKWNRVEQSKTLMRLIDLLISRKL